MENTLTVKLTLKELARINDLINTYVLSNATDIDRYDDGMKIKGKILDAMFQFNTKQAKVEKTVELVKYRNINNLTIKDLEDITGVECIYEDEKPNTCDFYDDMVAHITIGKFRFAVDIEKENDASVRRERKALEKTLNDAHINFIS